MLKSPFEKIMLITSVSNEIVQCVEKYWESAEMYISSTFLSIIPDELMSILVYVLLQTQMPEMIIHEKIIENFLTLTTNTSAIGYYNSSLLCALEYIQNGNFNAKISSKHVSKMSKRNSIRSSFDLNNVSVLSNLKYS